MVNVTAAIIRQNNKILICQRGAGGSCEYLWEFPGGKLESGETLEECIIRECKEELEIDIVVKNVFAESTYQYPDKEIAFTFFEADIVNGNLKANVHQDVRWIQMQELRNFKFCPADVMIVEKLLN